MYKLLVIIGVSISNALVVMQFDWERGNWTFMIRCGLTLGLWLG